MPPSDATPLIFIHGSGDSAHAWESVIARLPSEHTIAIDLPGHGAAIATPGPDQMSVADYAHAILNALPDETPRPLCLVGHSLGSAIALHLAKTHPHIVSHLVLIGAGARLRVTPTLLDAAQSQPTAALDQLTRDLGFAPGHAALAAAYRAAQPPAAPGALHRDLAACDRFDMLNDLTTITQPTLIIVGEADRLTPLKYARYLREHLTNATLTIIPDAGHYVFVEAPDAVADAIRAWLPSAASPAPHRSGS